jgi:hypothetical protein
MPYLGGVVLFGAEQVQTMTGSTNTYSLSSHVPGGATYFPSETDAADQSLKVGDDLWCVVAFSRSTTAAVPSLGTGWDQFAFLDVPAYPLYFFRYGSSPVDADGWNAWAPSLTISGNTGTQRLAVRLFAVRGGFAKDPTGGVDYHPGPLGNFTPSTDTWTAVNHASVGLIYGGGFSGGGAAPNNIATLTNPYYGWTPAAPTSTDDAYAYPRNRSWHARKTTDTQAPTFAAAANDYYAWWGFSIPYPNPLRPSWSIGRIAY